MLVFPVFLWFGAGGRPYSNFLASTLSVKKANTNKLKRQRELRCIIWCSDLDGLCSFRYKEQNTWGKNQTEQWCMSVPYTLISSPKKR